MTISHDLTPALDCPDCSASGHRVINHDDTCPVIAAVARVCATDASFFVDRPGCRWRWRDAERCEVAELEAAGLFLGDAPCRIHVENLDDGYHRRTFVVERVVVAGCLDIPPKAGWRR